MSLALGVLCTAAVVALALTVLHDFADRGLLLIAPWLIPAVVQDYWRNVLFREGRAGAAALNDSVWLAIMLLSLPAVWIWSSDWAVMAWWGGGAVAGASYGLVQTRVVPTPFGEAWVWFRDVVWPFGKWNAGTGILIAVGTQLETFAVLGILSAAALGGLRAASTVFAPLSLIIPAIALPGLPAIARAEASGTGRKLAVNLSVVAVVASGAFALMLFVGGWRLLPFLFGHEFTRYRDLIGPVSAAQVFAAAQVGFVLLIKARMRGRTLLLIQAVTTGVGLALVVTLSFAYGLTGAAWGGAGANLLSTVLCLFAIVRQSGEPAHTPAEGVGALPGSPPIVDGLTDRRDEE